MSFLQDCKEFQGELFGICNLFRDLSDKLFTSEIIDAAKHTEDTPNQAKLITSKDTDRCSAEEANDILGIGNSWKLDIPGSESLLDDLGKLYFLLLYCLDRNSNAICEKSSGNLFIYFL